MRILLDENLGWRLGRGLVGHEVESVYRLGWAGIQNGVLLEKANETGFEVLITMDSNMSFQQNLARQRLKPAPIHEGIRVWGIWPGPSA